MLGEHATRGDEDAAEDGHGDTQKLCCSWQRRAQHRGGSGRSSHRAKREHAVEPGHHRPSLSTSNVVPSALIATSYTLSLPPSSSIGQHQPHTRQVQHEAKAVV
ncbi:MAG: hypothetical protein U0163_09965 [Gemmatimonadaceae bacterium]